MSDTKIKQKKDTEYLGISARIHAMETRLLTRERMDRMIDAKDLRDAARVLAECGYGELSEVNAAGLEEALGAAQAGLYRDLAGAVEPALLDVFRCKYDYHNAKALVKAEALETKADGLLVGGGRYERAALAENFRRDSLGGYSAAFAAAVTQARKALAATGDPQQTDLILDRACFAELAALAEGSGSSFLRGYVAILADAANLRAAVRAARLNKGPEFLSQVLVPGGSVRPDAIAAARGSALERLFAGGPLAAAAAEGAAKGAPGSGHLTEFERLCDDAVMDYVAAGKRVSFGEQPVIGYLYAREAEQTAIRIIMTGRMAGLPGAVIRGRLRRSYC